jgi:DNA-binding SARP family transcriptional activator/TolB-like protein
MIHLRALGPPEVRVGDGRVDLSPKLLAVLVYVAVAPPGESVRRDKLLALFWPELDQPRARNALNQALHQLRRRLGDGAVESRGKEELAPAGAVVVDVARFEERLDAGHLAEALELYRGPFLEGFHLSGAPGFERWLDATRSRLRSAALQAALERSDRKEEEGDVAEAGRWLKWARDVAPTDERVIRRLLRHLDRQGDRARAVRVYRDLAKRLQDELGLEPSPETRSLVEEIRARSRPHHRTEARRKRAEITRDGRSGASRAGGSGPEGGGSAKTGADPSARRGGTSTTSAGWIRSHGTELAVVVAVASGAALALGAAVDLGGGFTGSSDGSPERPLTVAVLPCEDVAGEGAEAGSGSYFAEGFTAEITTEVFRVPGLRVLSPAVIDRFARSDLPRREMADSLGIDAVLECSVHRLEERARITTRLVDAGDDRHLWAESYDRRISDVFGLQSDVALAVARALDARLPAGAGEPGPGSGEPSAEAYDLYLKAAALVNHGQRAEAVRLLKEVVRLEPEFARAWHKLSVQYAHEVVSRGGDLAWADSGIAAGRRARQADASVGGGGLPFNLVAKGRFSEADSVWAEALDEGTIDIGQLNTWAFFETVRGRCDHAFEITAHAREIDPWANTRWGDALAWMCVGEHDRARDLLQGMVGWNRSMGLPPGPTTLAMAATLEMMRGDFSAAARRVEQLTRHHPENHLARSASAKLALMEGRWDEARRRYGRLHTRAPQARNAVSHLSVRMRLATALLRTGREARGLELLARAEEEALGRLREGSEHPGLAMELAHVHAARGDGEEAVRWLDRAVDLGWRWRGPLLWDPSFDELRERPGYRRVVATVARHEARMRNRALALRLGEEGAGEGLVAGEGPE